MIVVGFKYCMKVVTFKYCMKVVAFKYCVKVVAHFILSLNISGKGFMYKTPQKQFEAFKKKKLSKSFLVRVLESKS